MAENFSRSTASAPPAGTAASLANRNSSEPPARNSSFSNLGAVLASSDLSELLQTSSARAPVRCAPVARFRRISKRRTRRPRRAACHAASEPASPPPTMLMKSLLRILLKLAAVFGGDDSKFKGAAHCGDWEDDDHESSQRLFRLVNQYRER